MDNEKKVNEDKKDGGEGGKEIKIQRTVMASKKDKEKEDRKQ